MRRALCLMILLAVVAFALPVENVISFQGKLVEGGTPVDGTRNIEFKIYNVAGGGVASWTEYHPGVTVSGGLFNVELGGTSPLTAIDFDEQYWVGISVNGGAEITPRYKLTSSPYAMADGDWVVDGTNVYHNVGNVGIGTTLPLAPLHIDSDDHALRITGDGAISTTSFEGLGFQYFWGSGEGAIMASYPTGTGYLTFLTTTGGTMTEKMRLNYDGKLGIGTTSPSQLLHVAGNARITGAYYDSSNDPGTAGQILSSTGSGTDWITAGAGSDTDWAYSSGSGLTGDIYHTGDLGIGHSTDPSARLHIYDTEYADIDLENTGGTWKITNPVSGNLHFHKAFDVSNVLVLEALTGYVGINTNTPDNLLHIDAGASNGYVHLESDAFAFFQADGGGIGNSGITFKNDGVSKGLMWWDPSADQLRFSSGDAGAAEMVIDTDGNVGIGTTSPDEELVIGTPLGSGWVIPAVTVGDATGGAFEAGNSIYNIAMESSNTFSRARIISSGSGGYATGDIEFKCGMVGINQDSPDAMLHVGGATGDGIRFGSAEGFDDDGAYIIECNSDFLPSGTSLDIGTSANDWDDIWCVNLTETSDARLKTSIQDISYGLDEVMRLRPVSYERVDRPYLGRDIGFIAQEVLPIIEEAVQTRDYKVIDEETGEMGYIENEFMGIDYTDLIPVLIKGMQEQQGQIEEQQAQIEELKAEIESLKEAK